MNDLNIVEKVIALEGVELLQNLTPDQLSRIAAVAVTQKLPPGRMLIEPDRPLDALFIVLDGAVELRRGGEVIHTAGQNEALGTWALFDDAPMPITATTSEHTTLMRIGREDFQDLLADNVEIMRAVFSTLAKRFRKLIEQ